MKKTVFTLATITVILYGSILFAGSPLSSIKFYSAYQPNEKVQRAEERGILDGIIGSYILDEQTDIGQKVAIINALQWNRGNNNTETFKMFLGRKYGTGFENLDVRKLTGEESCCLGYMMLLDENPNAGDALSLLKQAQEKISDSYTVNLIYAIAQADKYMATSEKCKAWTICNQVRTNEALTADLKAEAAAIIFGEIDAFQKECN